jgi:hypothetical protein
VPCSTTASFWPERAVMVKPEDETLLTVPATT